MNNKGSKPSDESELPSELEFENTVDTSGVWFAAADQRPNVLFWHKADITRLSSNVCFWG
jgi:hypothetical protein